MTYDVYGLGNGLRRKYINPYELNGTVVGCNACYRDFDPDILVAIDGGIIYDIVRYEWAFNCNLESCYFTHNSWNPLPAQVRNQITFDPKSIIHETERTGDTFVIISGFDRKIETQVNYIIWEPTGWPNAQPIQNIGSRVEGWSTGTSAVYVVCEKLKPDNVYLLGFDHQSTTYDNLYADSPHYFKSDSEQVWSKIHSEWTHQLAKVFKWYPNINFYWVKGNGVNRDNLHFIEGV